MGAWRVGLVVAEFNRDITQALLDGALTECQLLGLQPQTHWVPGALELPVAVQWILPSQDAVVAVGCVIRGETSHYDLVWQVAAHGLGQLALSSAKPITQALLTTENEQQAWDRCGGREGHKGRDAVQAAYNMLKLKNQLLNPQHLAPPRLAKEIT